MPSYDVLGVLNNLGIDTSNIRNGNIITRCPLNINHKRGDKKASFAIRLSDGVYHCFANCGDGSLLQLVLLMRGGDLDDAAQFIIADRLKEDFFKEKYVVYVPK